MIDAGTAPQFYRSILFVTHIRQRLVAGSFIGADWGKARVVFVLVVSVSICLMCMIPAHLFNLTSRVTIWVVVWNIVTNWET